MSIFTTEEAIAFDKIVALSTKDKATVRDVLFALLTYATWESFNKEDNVVVIPYLCSLNLKYNEITNDKGIESNVEVTAKPSGMLLKEFVSIKNDEKPATKKYFEKQNRNIFKTMMQLGEDE